MERCLGFKEVLYLEDPDNEEIFNTSSEDISEVVMVLIHVATQSKTAISCARIVPSNFQQPSPAMTSQTKISRYSLRR